MLLSYKEWAVGPVAFLFTLRRGSWCIFETNQRKAANTQNLFSSVCTCDHAGGGGKRKGGVAETAREVQGLHCPCSTKKMGSQSKGSSRVWIHMETIPPGLRKISPQSDAYWESQPRWLEWFAPQPLLSVEVRCAPWIGSKHEQNQKLCSDPIMLAQACSFRQTGKWTSPPELCLSHTGTLCFLAWSFQRFRDVFSCTTSLSHLFPSAHLLPWKRGPVPQFTWQKYF